MGGNFPTACQSCPSGFARKRPAAHLAGVRTWNFFSNSWTRRMRRVSHRILSKQIDTEAVSQVCLPGWRTLKNGATDCMSCPEGEYGAACSKCASGYFREACDQSSESCNPKLCDKCPRGFWQENMGQPNCLPCFPGKFQPAETRLACHDCPVGYFGRGTNLTSCARCPLGSHAAERVFALSNLSRRLLWRELQGM